MISAAGNSSRGNLEEYGQQICIATFGQSRVSGTVGKQVHHLSAPAILGERFVAMHVAFAATSDVCCT